MFMSGVVKLTSGDDSWWNLTALQYHYETQPLPTPISWWANQFPPWFQAFSTIVMFGIEIGAPFLLFGPRRIRLIGVLALLTLQGLIAFSGNYCFFNLSNGGALSACRGRCRLAAPRQKGAATRRSARRVLALLDLDPGGCCCGSVEWTSALERIVSRGRMAAVIQRGLPLSRAIPFAQRLRAV